MLKKYLKKSALAVCFSATQMALATASSLSVDLDTLTTQISDMDYEQARALIISSGWKPLNNPAPDDLFLFSRDIYDQGFTEVDMCAPTGSAPCTFYFTNAQGQYLKVQTVFEEPIVSAVHLLKDKTAFDQEPHS